MDPHEAGLEERGIKFIEYSKNYDEHKTLDIKSLIYVNTQNYAVQF
jgi:hypothetical protein